ncbi:pyridoxamine 5'-phosphate oxidase-related FMN-binding [Labilithrix luteola]|uniref:Pyridoxamine 5'-phosphate oxidase-related FMN-binding n=1 Tax=Labilithrix luteola TaxID=1391654 RepID=A0A0K1PNL2_9BACT|nr:pyridoxamine 5'-phosphate oxidase family protein [Labilithrix luteola]AKU95130.1 pyridoxamine 5'-phosphate oxidase-related FMN-binding [Labilithrix luteola]
MVVPHLARLYRRWARTKNVDDVDRILRAARSTMRRKKYCVLATRSVEGIGARVLQPFPPDDDFGVWLGTSPTSRKTEQLRADSTATLVYEDDGKAACVVLMGNVRIVDARAERVRRFMPSWWAFFPDGPEGDDFVLLRFEPHRIEVWDAARHITPEPFGLRSARLTRRDGTWTLES